MTSLKESLDALTASLPDVPAELGALKDQAERVERSVVDFLNELGEKDAQAATRLDELKHALEGLDERSEGERTRLESQLDALDSRLEGSLEGLRSHGVALSETLEEAGAAMVSLKDLLAQDAASTRAAEQEAAQELADLGEAARAGTEALRTAFEAAAGEADALQAAVVDVGEGVKQAVEGALARMQALAEQGRERIDETVQKLQDLRSTHEAEVPQHGARLDAGHRAVSGELRERVARELKARIAESTQAVLEALAQMKTEGLEGAVACRNDRETLEAGFAALRKATEPMPEAIEAVKQAADQVGLSWG